VALLASDYEAKRSFRGHERYYPGMSAPEMEQRIVNITERAASQTVNGIDHIESTSFTGIGVIKIYMQEGSSTALGISQLDSRARRSTNQLLRRSATPHGLRFHGL
jgi:multidrug efflux pump subunit AcrB